MYIHRIAVLEGVGWRGGAIGSGAVTHQTKTDSLFLCVLRNESYVTKWQPTQTKLQPETTSKREFKRERYLAEQLRSESNCTNPLTLHFSAPWAKVDDFCQSLLFPAQHNFLEFRPSSADKNILLKFLFCILDEYLFFYFFVLDGFSNGGSGILRVSYIFRAHKNLKLWKDTTVT